MRGSRLATTLKAFPRRKPTLISTGTKTLTVGPWVLPTKNADGTAIGTITNQTIYYDTVSRMGTDVPYTYSTLVGDGTTLTKVISNLLANTTYYVAMTVSTASGESDYSAEAFATTAP